MRNQAFLSKGLGSTVPPDSKSTLRESVPVRLSVSELMALRNAAAKGGLIDYRDVKDATRDKLRGLGLIKRRDDVVTDKAKLQEAIRTNREALAGRKARPDDYAGLQKFREVLYACCERLRNTRHSGMFLTELGQRYAAMNVAIALPGERRPADKRTSHTEPSHG